MVIRSPSKAEDRIISRTDVSAVGEMLDLRAPSVRKSDDVIGETVRERGIEFSGFGITPTVRVGDGGYIDVGSARRTECFRPSVFTITVSTSIIPDSSAVG